MLNTWSDSCEHPYLWMNSSDDSVLLQAGVVQGWRNCNSVGDLKHAFHISPTNISNLLSWFDIRGWYPRLISMFDTLGWYLWLISFCKCSKHPYSSHVISITWWTVGLPNIKIWHRNIIGAWSTQEGYNHKCLRMFEGVPNIAYFFRKKYFLWLRTSQLVK